jgi:hypothetical protein
VNLPNLFYIFVIVIQTILMQKIDKFIRGNFLFIVIILAICFAFYKKATIWQQKTDSIVAKPDSVVLADSLKIIK